MHLDFGKNLGNTDKIIRVIFGILLIGQYVSGAIRGGWGIAAVAFALAQFVEVYFSY
ncbi:hypothetical protein SOV_52030 [Sporomusa ovata DSM 2662]|uniref:Inner membrane protein YgaP-like transmembrane domain-containing protein n=1 Tax=Sporomusa ovata TaxID=2378 RepID=A0A0U1L1A0_9FIRM|nr:YgaP-like transmembrane domain [Sporomusa ovata]EQB27575.1 hypothetical protein SOV_2c04720 [Sporomusa ovata DSM 2662]CQR73431.1 hypothetical protein SpAn4DRAFT_2663 [Sporomusa ovata]